jgi:hypothetical protein
MRVLAIGKPAGKRGSARFERPAAQRLGCDARAGISIIADAARDGLRDGAGPAHKTKRLWRECL